MANTVNTFDFAAQTLAQFLATSVDDGTQADVFQALKQDQAGEEAAATEIRIAAGQIYGNGVDDFVLAAYPLLRQVALGGVGGSRLTETSSPTIGGAPPNMTYTVAADERFTYVDSIPFANALNVTLPAIASLTPGQEFGIRLPLGNPQSALTFTVDAADTIENPATGIPAGPPGTALVIAIGTYTGPTVLTWKMSTDGGDPLWQLEYDREGAGGGGGGRLDQTLALGPNTDAEPLVVNLGDSIYFDNRTTPLGDPSTTPTLPQNVGFQAQAFHRKFSFGTSVVSGSGTFVDLTEIFNYTGSPDGFGNLLHVRIVVDRTVPDFPSNLEKQIAVLEEIWQISFGTWSRVETLFASASAAANFQLAVSSGDLWLQVLDDATVLTASQGVVELTLSPGFAAF